jgi:hypothetical protein
MNESRGNTRGVLEAFIIGVAGLENPAHNSLPLINRRILRKSYRSDVVQPVVVFFRHPAGIEKG